MKFNTNIFKFIHISGGVYSGELRQNSTHILVINSSPKKSKKYFHAKSWGLACVKSSWVYECIEKGYAVSSERHAIVPELRCSTPTENKEDVPSKYSSLFQQFCGFLVINLKIHLHLCELS